MRTGCGVTAAMARRCCSPYRREGPVLTTTTPSPVAMKAVLMMLQPLAGRKSATAPSITQVPGAIWRGCRR